MAVRAPLPALPERWLQVRGTMPAHFRAVWMVGA